MKRRLLLGGSTALGIGSVAGWMALPSESMSTTDGASESEITHLHIIAHPDDDLYFFNLDVEHAIAAGHGIVNVCITGGEANGRNGRGDDQPVDFEGYVASRYAGLRAAYAEMVQTNRHATWRREALELGDKTVELTTLEETPQIHLVFLNLWEDSAKYSGSPGKRLMDLWDGTTTEHHTLEPPGSPTGKPTIYTKDALTDTLIGLLDLYQPRVVRTLDPDPDPQVHDDSNPQYADQDGYSDHIDHTAAGVIAFDALAKWRDRGGPADTIVEAYRGYYNRRWPRNLSSKALKAKTRYTDIYAWNDTRECGEDTGCGDRKIGTPSIGNAFGAGTVHRFPSGTQWLQRNAEGRLFAAGVAQGRLNQWLEPVSGGGAWSRDMDGSDQNLLPTVQLVTTAADVWYALGVKATVGTKPEDHVREVVIRPFTFTGSTGEWTSLGNPEADSDSAFDRRNMGTPVAVARDTKLLLVAVRNRDRAISVRWQQRDDTWSDWDRLDGPVIQDGLSAVVTEDGYIEIFGAAETGVARWWRVADSPWQYEVIDTAAPAAPPTAVGLPGGGAMLVVRRAESEHMVAYYRGSGDEYWDNTAHELGGNGGIGTVAALAPPDWEGRVALATRDDDGTVSFAIADASARAMETTWADNGPQIMHAPSLCLDADDKMTIAVLGTDGRVHTATQPEPGYDRPVDWVKVSG